MIVLHFYEILYVSIIDFYKVDILKDHFLELLIFRRLICYDITHVNRTGQGRAGQVKLYLSECFSALFNPLFRPNQAFRLNLLLIAMLNMSCLPLVVSNSASFHMSYSFCYITDE